MWLEYQWIVVCGGLLAVFVAYGIGANDVANAFGSSVGSKAITIKQALVIAAIFEFGGAVLLGAGVTDTVRKGIADFSKFQDAPELLMYGMLCVLLATGLWLILASYFELPVSTTHSTVGGVIGMAICAKGAGAVTWMGSGGNVLGGVVGIVLSWVFSPVLSAILAIVLFGGVRVLVLRSQNSYVRSWYVFPVLVFLTVLVNSFFIIFKGAKSKLKGLEPVDAVWISFVIGGVAALIVTFGVVPFLKKRVDREFEAAEQAEAAKAQAAEEGAEKGVDEGKVQIESVEAEPEKKNFWSTITSGANHDVHSAIEEDDAVNAIHEFSEKFDPKTEESFKYLQVFTAICDSFSHGANDVANSIGPFAAIWGIYKYEGLKKKTEVPIWILVLGGFGIVLGLATYGYKIMCSIGVKMCRITPTRGFAIELGAAVVIVIGSQLGIPLSTTHCQVGATVGVGLLESLSKGVNWKLIGKVVVGWVMTLIIVGLTTAGFFAQGVYAPSVVNIREREELQGGIKDAVIQMVNTLSSSNIDIVGGNLTLINETITNLTNHSLYEAQVVDSVKFNNVLLEATTVTLDSLIP
mmetsp:Transcript_38607/g.91507  ORF Transcript_38607/g.91507 Transcript_38607/m.91507 type:complete len:578 (+) Transcript_38607:91-1824(+)